MKLKLNNQNNTSEINYLDTLKGLVKTHLVKYGDHLSNLYQKVKTGGALNTTTKERIALYQLANKTQKTKGDDKTMDELSFTKLFNKIGENLTLNQMTQWGGSYPLGKIKSKKVSGRPSRRLRSIYYNYLDYLDY